MRVSDQLEPRPLVSTACSAAPDLDPPDGTMSKPRTTTSLPPRIADLSWGRIEVEGYQPFKDAKVYPGGAREWDWDETGTDHNPGIQPADVEELLEHGAQVVILSQGNYSRLKTCPETIRMLEEKGVETHVLDTKEAVELFNELRASTPVGGLFHSTC